VKLSVFILAAGLGERLRPITNRIPKPLLPILGKPVLESVLKKVSALPVTAIGVNLHHKKEEIARWISQSAFSGKVEVFPEDPVLGTGGALKNAETFLKNSTFLVHNSDILSDIDLRRLIAFHVASKNTATLAVHDYPEFNKLTIDEKGFLKSIGTSKENMKCLAFTGIAVYEPAFLGFLPAGISSVVEAWSRTIESGKIIGTFDVSGCYWTDIGTPASYTKAVINELRNSGETIYIHPSVQNCNNVEMDGYVAIENGSVLNKGLSLRNCVVLPETRIETKEPDDTQTECLLTLFWGKGRGDTHPDSGRTGESSYENCILGSGFKIDIDETTLFEFTEGDKLLIGTGGSDRKYYRVNRHRHSAVLMQCPATDPDFERHIEYTRFFKKYSISVPDLIDMVPEMKNALFEDLGDLSLYSWLKCQRKQVELEEMYRKVLDILVLLHTSATEHLSECPLLQKRMFDYEYFRWETSYFLDRFVKGITNSKINYVSALNDEFHALALKADAFHKTIIHRDFQSQNIMIMKGGVPRLLDYQGARIGPPAYDVVSILWDPYHRLDDEIRKRLLDYYIERTSSEKFRHSLLPCRLQRHMQALGAYGFLSMVKGKKYFLKYIPEGLRLLKEDLSVAENGFPVLCDLLKDL
jgi:NDP-sugar pyrophosphorylase family protein/aminoglycoside/choline kinase family phosphotransferase